VIQWFGDCNGLVTENKNKNKINFKEKHKFKIIPPALIK
jgi:hypothetical protein